MHLTRELTVSDIKGFQAESGTDDVMHVHKPDEKVISQLCTHVTVSVRSRWSSTPNALE